MNSATPKHFDTNFGPTHEGTARLGEKPAICITVSAQIALLMGNIDHNRR